MEGVALKTSSPETMSKMGMLRRSRWADASIERMQPSPQVRQPLLALIPHIQVVGIAGGGNIAAAFVNGAI